MVVVATWNLENLYRPGSGFGPKSEDAYQAKLSSLASTIRASEAEVVGVQEVGDPEALTDLAVVIGGFWNGERSTAPDVRGSGSATSRGSPRATSARWWICLLPSPSEGSTIRAVC